MAMLPISRALATRDLVWSESAPSHPPPGAEPGRWVHHRTRGQMLASGSAMIASDPPGRIAENG
jgi:hypothetical protein